MGVETHRFHVRTRGNDDVIDITALVREPIESGSIRAGVATVFVVGSTAAVTTTEFEPGLAKHDLPAAFERLASKELVYRHEQTWHDDNGHAHVRASIVGPSLSVPVLAGTLPLGTWQQIVLIDFDTRARDRDIIVQVVGE